MSVFFITGASRGLGAEIVAEALAAGHHVVATARTPESITARFSNATDDLLAIGLDVTSERQAAEAVESALAAFGRIDVVVNNAGSGLLGAVEEAPDLAVRAVYDTNVFGLLNVLRATLPSLRAQGSGRVVNISSIGGFVGAPGWGIYDSTKFAVEGLSEALSRELAPLGITVTIVEPGYFRTDFLDASSLHTEQTVIDDYDATAGEMRRIASNVNHTQRGDPVKAAVAIVRLATNPAPPLRVQLGEDSFDAIASKLEFVAAEQHQWREVSLSTDHDDVLGVG